MALVVALLGGLGLRAIASPPLEGSAPLGPPPVEAFSGLDAEAYRYARATGSRESEILLLGSSLVRYAVPEETLAKDLGGGDTLVFNAALDGGRLWDVLRLVDAMPPSRARGRKLAILEVNRVSSETAVLPHPYARARAVGEGHPPWDRSLVGAAEGVWEEVPPRQDPITWMQQTVYGKLARRLPGLVPVPPPLPRVLWLLTEAQRRRAVGDKDPVSMGKGMHGTVRWTPEVLKLLVGALHAHGFRVLLLQTPLHGAMLETMAQAPGAEETERAYRAAVLDKTATGADDVLALDRMSDIGGDDAMLADYGHLLPAGAELLTRRLAEHLLGASWLWGDERASY